MGYFFREIGYSQDSDYVEFCSLELEILYRWSKTSWSAATADSFIYITINNNNELWIGKSEREMDQPNMKLMGVYREKDKLKTKQDFKKALKKYLLLNADKREGYKFPSIGTEEICNYMRWKIDEDRISDFIMQ